MRTAHPHFLLIEYWCKAKMSTTSTDYKVPALCLLLTVGTYYSLQAFIPKDTKTRARRLARRLISWRKEPRARQDLTRGDGLQSIFTNSTLLLDDSQNIPAKCSIPEMDAAYKNEESGLNEVQQIAFDSLLACGVIDSTIGLGVLKAALRNAKLLHRAKGDFIFKHDDQERELLMFLKSGSCEVLYQNGGESVVVSVISGRRVLASVVDIVSWIIGHSNFQCHMSVRCTEKCEVIAIPSPHNTTKERTGGGEGEEGAEPEAEEVPQHSSLYVCSYANLVRSLLIRFSRTTIISSLFYLGLAEHM